MQKLTHPLNPEQEKAKDHIEGPLLVLAGAGSGKTRVLTTRISHLINIGISPAKIVALTFTNKAAKEMKSRVYSLTKQNVLTATFHSLCYKLLQEDISNLGYKTPFTIYDDNDSLKLLKQCLKELNYKDEKKTTNSLRSKISSFKNALILPDEVTLDHQTENDKILLNTYQLYQRRLKEYNALDFDDLLLLTAVLFTNHATVLKKWQERFNFILVDEYQDTNEVQVFIIKKLAGSHHNIFAVGDPDQSIYAWRGAKVQNILDFDKHFPTASTISLEQNYRSTNHILSAANSVISHNTSRLEKNLWSDLGDGDKVFLSSFMTDRLEANFVIKTINTYHNDQDLPLNEIAILYRTNSQSRIIEDHLLKSNIPYIIIGGLSFYQRKEIKDILAYLRLLISPYDFISFTRVINLPKRGIGPSLITKLQNTIDENQISIIDLLSSPNPPVKLNIKQQTAIAQFISAYHHIVDLIKKGKPLIDVLKEILIYFEYETYLKEDEETYKDRYENIQELGSKMVEFEEESNFENSLHPIYPFLEELSLQSSLDKHQTYEPQVSLMTLHNSKGLEFTLNFMVGMEEDLFPHINSKSNNDEVEEERRLCYVGMTRAKKHLYMTYSKTRMLWGSVKEMTPSRFIDELDYSHVEIIKPKKITNYYNTPTDEEECTYQVGMRISHPSFGEGRIEKVYNTSVGITVDVFFCDEQLTRSLATKYAKLSIV